MCQATATPINMFTTTSATCPTIKANARIRRSRQWRDQQQSENMSSNSNHSIKKKQNTRRRCRPTANKIIVDDDDVSTASTASLSADDSSCMSPSSTTPIKKSNRRTRRRKKSTSTTRRRPTKVVAIVPELTDEEKALYLAIDCEMVGIGHSGHTSRLARVTLVNYDGETVYDAYVKVEEKVTDYRTFVSGITEEDLSSDDAVTFNDAQSTVMELIQDKILVGHGLKNDFTVLGITHPWYITRDTAKYEPFMRPATPFDWNPTNADLVPKKLKVLAKDKLGMIIQEEGKAHCPVEDAVAALELFKKHIVKWEKVVHYKLAKTAAMMNR